ncbi:BLOC-1-related complex subunit 8 isoform X2 [Oryzias latipes]
MGKVLVLIMSSKQKHGNGLLDHENDVNQIQVGKPEQKNNQIKKQHYGGPGNAPESETRHVFVYACYRLSVSDKFTESMYVLANEPSVALYRLQEHVRRSLPELVQHKTDMQNWEEQSQGAIYTVEYACSAVKSMTNSSFYFKNIDSLLRQAINWKEQSSNSQGRRKRAVDSSTPKEGGERHRI